MGKQETDKINIESHHMASIHSKYKMVMYETFLQRRDVVEPRM